ncbi:hypothetical protein CONLIGDRAFT_707811 [Coniochaeta ligniaria NRRL 30616]|uniref:Uncharacterized protein n=1 Tax=Coniochaeta ligniaria NRRL 30616 TaxID=1408157 RepID=A0A1J7II54_9PEZI|nr:hypothetical protein CONLIGDRAFT_707811 [Coniochaeta ligniaria NRRL 30616]
MHMFEDTAHGGQSSTDLIDTSTTTIATLLILLCPNITIIRIHGVDAITPLGRFLVNNNYEKLKDVQSLDYVRYFHRLPAINFLSFERLEEYQHDVVLFSPKSSTYITRLNISYTNMSEQMIGTIIRIPKTLEELSVSTGGLQGLEGDSIVDAGVLGKCLLEHKDCLRELDLDVAASKIYDDNTVDECEEYERDEEMSKWYFIQDQKDGDSGGLPLRLEDLRPTREHPARSIGSMHDLTALNRLSIRIGLILGYNDIESYLALVTRREAYRAIPGWNNNQPYATSHVPSASYRLVDALPPNLEFLRLYGYRKGEVEIIDDHVKELLERKADRFPKLGEIEGVDEFLPGVPGTYDADPEVDHHWLRSTENLDWVED